MSNVPCSSKKQVPATYDEIAQNKNRLQIIMLGVGSKRAGLPNGKKGSQVKKPDNRATNSSIGSHNSIRFDPHKVVIDGIANCIQSKFELARPSWKNFPESTREVDLIYCHRPDTSTPILETVRSMNYVIDKGWAFYWGTSEWSAQQITEAWGVAQRLDLVGPIVVQPEYNLLSRHKLLNERNKNKRIRKELDLLMKHVYKKSSSNDERQSQEDN
ncbi:hypothetical protein FXO37_15940 [Capsicum annuum]|nr:hypothetical protein FXO37_15940 [Capsicum annuum]